LQIGTLDNDEVGTDLLGGRSEHQLGHSDTTGHVVACDNDVFLPHGKWLVLEGIIPDFLALAVECIDVQVHNDTRRPCPAAGAGASGGGRSFGQRRRGCGVQT